MYLVITVQIKIDGYLSITVQIVSKWFSKTKPSLRYNRGSFFEKRRNSQNSLQENWVHGKVVSRTTLGRTEGRGDRRGELMTINVVDGCVRTMEEGRRFTSLLLLHHNVGGFQPSFREIDV